MFNEMHLDICEQTNTHSFFFSKKKKKKLDARRTDATYSRNCSGPYKSNCPTLAEKKVDVRIAKEEFVILEVYSVIELLRKGV